MSLYYLISAVTVLVQTQNRLLFWPALPILVAASRKEEGKKVYLLAFLTGITSDLLIGRTLGETAIFLILLSAFVYLGNIRFSHSPRIFLVVFVISQLVFRALNF